MTRHTTDDRVMAGLSAWRKGDLPTARERLLDAWWSLDDPPAELCTALAHIALHFHDTEEAAWWLAEADDRRAPAESLAAVAAAAVRLLPAGNAEEWLGRLAAARPHLPGVPEARERLAALDPAHATAVARACTLRRAGRHGEARRVLEAARRHRPDHAPLHNELGQVAYEAGRLEEAARHFGNAHRLNPADSYATNNLGKLAARRNHSRDAERWFRTTLSHHPGDVYALVGLGNLALHRRRWDRAATWFETALAARPDHPVARRGLARARSLAEREDLLAQARTLRRRRDYARAEKLLVEAAGRHDNAAPLLVELGLIAHGAGRLDDARTRFALAYAQEPENPVVLNMLGVLETAGGRTDDAACDRAQGWFAKALAVNPHEPRTLNNLAWLLLRRGSLEAAETRFLEILRLRPDDRRALKGLGEIALRRGDYEQAQQWWDEAWWRRGREDPVLLTGLAKAAMAQGRFDTARALLEDAAARFPRDHYVLTSLAYACLCQDEPDAAISWLDRAGRVVPADSRVNNLRGKAAQKKGHFQEARRWFARTLETAPDNTYAMLGLGWTAYEEGFFDEAHHWFEQVLALAPANAHAHTGLGLAKTRLGQYQEAEDCYRTSLQQSFHRPALWHWFRLSTLAGNAQQLGWFLARALDAGGLEKRLRAELLEWQERVRTLMRLTREGEDPWPFVHDVGTHLPRAYHAV